MWSVPVLLAIFWSTAVGAGMSLALVAEDAHRHGPVVGGIAIIWVVGAVASITYLSKHIQQSQLVGNLL